MTEIIYKEAPSVRMPFLDEGRHELGVRFVMTIGDEAKFVWKKGCKPCLYGLETLEEGRKTGFVVLANSEVDAQILRYNGFPAVAIPINEKWNEQRDANRLEKIEKVYLLFGSTVPLWPCDTKISSKIQLVSMTENTRISQMFREGPGEFKQKFSAILSASVSLKDHAQIEEKKQRENHWQKCKDLLSATDILGVFNTLLDKVGLVGEQVAATILFLCIITRLLGRPTSVIIKGPSSVGKSFLYERVFLFFPASAFYVLTAMSEKALIYMTEPLKHRFLVISEAAGVCGDFVSYIVRSLLSEGQVRYMTVEKTAAGIVPRLIKRDGPTGLILTTTQTGIHPENETRMLTITATDTTAQTAAVMQSLAAQQSASPVDFSPWHALQCWLDLAEHRVVIPYADALAKMIPPVAVRLRRDFKAVLNLIEAHAILHQVNRKKDPDGRIIASREDYKVVRNLVAPLIAEGVESTVPKHIRETVDAVRDLRRGSEHNADDDGNIMIPDPNSLTIGRLAAYLRLDRSSVLRRVKMGIHLGYLENSETHENRPILIELGDPLPADREILPTPESLEIG